MFAHIYMYRLTIVLLALFACAAGKASAQQVSSNVSTVERGSAGPIPLRDGVKLDGAIYRPRNQSQPQPCVFTLTPYTAVTAHDRGMYFAAHGYVFLSIDSRGRGDSGGVFKPMVQEGRDAYDVVEWLAKQPFCNGKIAMWGGSFSGYNQWMAAAEHAPHLTTIVPAAAAAPGVDFPGVNNIVYSISLQWLQAAVSGRTLQAPLLGDSVFWAERFRDAFVRHDPYRQLDVAVGGRSEIFQEWLDHPTVDAYWDHYNPTPQQYAGIDMPVLTITGQYDGDQLGALAHYRRHLAAATAGARAKHYLVIGPWDHGQTRSPSNDVGGLKLGPASVLDLNDLHRQWYDWTLKGGAPPAFLRERVAYYVTGAETWRYADSLDAVTKSTRALYLASDHGYANDAFRSGRLQESTDADGAPDHYRYDPLDVSTADLQATTRPWELTDQREVVLAAGQRLIYHSAPIERDTEISGAFRLSAWVALDQPDTDFSVQVYQIAPDGSSLLLTSTRARARYRDGLRAEKLVPKGEVIEYRFDNFPFVARKLSKGSRLRLVFGPLNSIYWQKNYNSGGVVARESIKEARTVTVALYHDAQHPSALYVPLGVQE